MKHILLKWGWLSATLHKIEQYFKTPNIPNSCEKFC